MTQNNNFEHSLEGSDIKEGFTSIFMPKFTSIIPALAPDYQTTVRSSSALLRHQLDDLRNKSAFTQSGVSSPNNIITTYTTFNDNFDKNLLSTLQVDNDHNDLLWEQSEVFPGDLSVYNEKNKFNISKGGEYMNRIPWYCAHEGKDGKGARAYDYDGTLLDEPVLDETCQVGLPPAGAQIDCYSEIGPLVGLEHTKKVVANSILPSQTMNSICSGIKIGQKYNVNPGRYTSIKLSRNIPDTCNLEDVFNTLCVDNPSQEERIAAMAKCIPRDPEDVEEEENEIKYEELVEDFQEWVGVRIYQHGDFSDEGWKVDYPIGDYNRSGLYQRARGIADGDINDELSSLVVAQGFEVELFQDDGFSGTSATFPAGMYNITDLAENGIRNDSVTSMKVKRAVSDEGQDAQDTQGATEGQVTYGDPQEVRFQLPVGSSTQSNPKEVDITISTDNSYTVRNGNGIPILSVSTEIDENNILTVTRDDTSISYDRDGWENDLVLRVQIGGGARRQRGRADIRVGPTRSNTVRFKLEVTELTDPGQSTTMPDTFSAEVEGNKAIVLRTDIDDSWGIDVTLDGILSYSKEIIREGFTSNIREGFNPEEDWYGDVATIPGILPGSEGLGISPSDLMRYQGSDGWGQLFGDFLRNEATSASHAALAARRENEYQAALASATQDRIARNNMQDEELLETILETEQLQSPMVKKFRRLFPSNNSEGTQRDFLPTNGNIDPRGSHLWNTEKCEWQPIE